MKIEYVKNLRVAIILSVLLLPLNLTMGQSSFNGKMKFKIQKKNGKTNYITYYSQNGNLRMEMPGKSGKGYIISGNGKMEVVMPSRKMYLEYSGGLSKMMQSNPLFNNSSKTNNSNIDNIEWQKMWEKAKTSNTKTILGYKCTEFIMPRDDGGVRHIWTTKDLGNIVILQNPMSSSPFFNEIKKMGAFFPLLSEETDGNGNVISKFEVVEINNEKVDDDLFKIPAEYKKMTIPGMNMNK